MCYSRCGCCDNTFDKWLSAQFFFSVYWVDVVEQTLSEYTSASDGWPSPYARTPTNEHDQKIPLSYCFSQPHDVRRNKILNFVLAAATPRTLYIPEIQFKFSRMYQRQNIWLIYFCPTNGWFRVCGNSKFMHKVLIFVDVRYVLSGAHIWRSMERSLVWRQWKRLNINWKCRTLTHPSEHELKMSKYTFLYHINHRIVNWAG